MPVRFPSCFRVLPLVAACVLAACGGGSDDDAGPGSAPTSTGVFLDSPVAGLSYTTSSGLSGVTNAAGQFQYRPGDTVTFSIGSLQIGSASGGATVTPAHITADQGGEDSNRFTNLLVLLQSLDADGDPENGITLPASFHADLVSVGAALDHTPDNFVLNAALNTVVTSAGGTVVDPAAAQSHFAEQNADEFMAQATGIWALGDEPSYLRITPTGRYLSIDGDEPGVEIDGVAGVEVGTLKRNAAGNITATQIGIDTNGGRGFSHPGNILHSLSYDADDDTLELVEEDQGLETYVLQRVESVDNSIIGIWSLAPDLKAAGTTVLFRQDGRYVMGDPQGDEESAGCGGPGVETASYTWINDTLTLSSADKNTNGCAGLIDGDEEAPVLPSPISATVNGDVLTLVLPDTTVQLYRIR